MITSEDNPDDWFRFASERLKAADILHASAGATWTGVELLHEAAERYLKGWLIGRGWKLERTHDLGKLIQSAAGYLSAFDQWMDFAEDLTQQFWLQHYPGDELTEQPLNYEELRRQTSELVNLILNSNPATDRKV